MGGRIVTKNADERLGLPILGKVKVGIKSEGGYPQSVDYFVATGKYAPLFNEVFGEKPNTLLIYFPSDNPELCCNESYVYRDNAGKKVAEGDGEVFYVYSSKEGRRVRVTTDELPDVMDVVSQKFPSKTGWQISLTIRFVLPLVNKIYGCWEFCTKGAASTIPQIRDCFDAMVAKNGKIAGVLCDLSVKFAKSDSPKASRYPVVSLVPNETEQNISKIQSLKQIGQ